MNLTQHTLISYLEAIINCYNELDSESEIINFSQTVGITKEYDFKNDHSNDIVFDMVQAITDINTNRELSDKMKEYVLYVLRFSVFFGKKHSLNTIKDVRKKIINLYSEMNDNPNELASFLKKEFTRHVNIKDENDKDDVFVEAIQIQQKCNDITKGIIYSSQDLLNLIKNIPGDTCNIYN